MYSVPRSTPKTAATAKTFVAKRKTAARSAFRGDTLEDAIMGGFLVGVRAHQILWGASLINEERRLCKAIKGKKGKTINVYGRKKSQKVSLKKG